jgi:hypothetical protein
MMPLDETTRKELAREIALTLAKQQHAYEVAVADRISPFIGASLQYAQFDSSTRASLRYTQARGWQAALEVI